MSAEKAASDLDWFYAYFYQLLCPVCGFQPVGGAGTAARQMYAHFFERDHRR